MPARHGQRRRGHHDHTRIIATAARGRAGCHLDRALPLPRLPGRPGILAADEACLCLRPAGIRPVAGRRAARHRARFPPMWCCVTWRIAGRRCCRVARAATCTRSGTAATSATRLRRSAGGWPRCRACSATGRCGTRLRPAHPASRRGTPGSGRGARRAAGPPGRAEAALWPAGPRAAAVAPRPGPRRDHRAAGELPHRLEKVCPATDLPANENAWSPVFEHPVSVPSCLDYRNNIPDQPQNSHCRGRKAHIGVPWRAGCLAQI
jgi:hypothetical protein